MSIEGVPMSRWWCAKGGLFTLLEAVDEESARFGAAHRFAGGAPARVEWWASGHRPHRTSFTAWPDITDVTAVSATAAHEMAWAERDRKVTDEVEPDPEAVMRASGTEGMFG